MTVLDVRARALATKPNTFYLPEKDAWFAAQAFANEKVDLRWYLIKQSDVRSLAPRRSRIKSYFSVQRKKCLAFANFCTQPS